MSFFDDLLKDPALMALLGGTAMLATGGLAAPAVAGAAGGGGLLGSAALGAEAVGAAASGSGILGSAAVADPIAAYLATGATEASTLGSAFTGAGGSAGAVGQGSTAGLLNMGKQAYGYAKPIGQAMDAGMKIKGMFDEGPQAPIQPSPIQQNMGGNQVLGQLAQQGTQDQQQTMQADIERRKRRMGILGDSQ